MPDPQSEPREAAPDRSNAQAWSETALAAFIHDHFDTFPKRDLIDFFAAQPDAVVTLPDLEAQLQTDRFILLRQGQELKALGLLDYHYADEHTRVWHLAPTEWAQQMVRTVVAHWAKHPDQRRRIVRHGHRPSAPSG